ncbi:MAG: mandelate racemase/muconate lactonizing enzyme family protein [Planctomycetes bacterium]|nr:mandelate racemase/muconate lactonizing enzyme family protein [Planctomycetota bacterium]
MSDIRIVSVRSELLQLPLARPLVSGMSSSGRGEPLESIFMLASWITTDHGPEGFGFAYFLQGGGRAAQAIVEHDLGPALIGEDPLDHERLWQKLYWRVQSIGRRGLVVQVQSALDLALWDLKGKVAGLPLWKLLGGARPSAAVYGSDGGWMWMTVEQIVEAAQEYLAQGMMGTKLKVGHDDPRVDLRRVEAVRKALGDDVWLAVDANQRWDHSTALKMGREFERLGCAWFEEPMTCEDPAGHARLAEALDIPIALGETLQSRHEIQDYLLRDAVDIVQPDLTRLGGLTEFLKIAHFADGLHRPVWPHLMMEASIQLACGLGCVGAIEYMPWLTAAFAQPPAIRDGRMLPPNRPGMGIEISPEAREQFRFEN